MYRLTAGDKPIDFGRHGMCGCLTHEGRFVALNAYHDIHGFVTVTSAPPFPDTDRYDSERVRAYRRALLTQEGFGLVFDVPIVSRQVIYTAAGVPLLRLALADGTIALCQTRVEDNLGVVQTWQFSQPTACRYDGSAWLQRFPYVQLTEGGVLPPVSVQSHVWAAQEGVGIVNDALPYALCVGAHGLELCANVDGSVTWCGQHAPTSAFVLWIGMGQTPEEARAALSSLQAVPLQQLSETTQLPADDVLLARAYAYGALCTVPVGDQRVCLITDHMILPLSWNRDAYYMARLLLCDRTGYETVWRHLLWMFETVERVNGLWGRSYLANGRVKDKGFQLDQQLFPLLELAEYVAITDDVALLARLTSYIRLIFAHLEAYRAPHALLYATEETPADDPIALPYPLSSHVLLWRVLDAFTRLGFAKFLPHTPEAVAESIAEYFVMERDGVRLYAYATDGKGQHHAYHDANDMPLALMPVWGFCAPDDPLWRATIDFAFSEANVGGFYDGVLGSVHTPAPWTLGDLQALIVARVLRDEAREVSALARLQRAAQWDGALPEAYDPRTGEVVSRHWFLWANAAYACIQRGVFDL